MPTTILISNLTPQDFQRTFSLDAPRKTSQLSHRVKEALKGQHPGPEDRMDIDFLTAEGERWNDLDPPDQLTAKTSEVLKGRWEIVDRALDLLHGHHRRKLPKLTSKNAEEYHCFKEQWTEAYNLFKEQWARDLETLTQVRLTLY